MWCRETDQKGGGGERRGEGSVPVWQIQKRSGRRWHQKGFRGT